MIQALLNLTHCTGIISIFKWCIALATALSLNTKKAICNERNFRLAGPVGYSRLTGLNSNAHLDLICHPICGFIKSNILAVSGLLKSPVENI